MNVQLACFAVKFVPPPIAIRTLVFHAKHTHIHRFGEDLAHDTIKHSLPSEITMVRAALSPTTTPDDNDCKLSSCFFRSQKLLKMEAKQSSALGVVHWESELLQGWQHSVASCKLVQLWTPWTPCVLIETSQHVSIVALGPWHAQTVRHHMNGAVRCEFTQT